MSNPNQPHARLTLMALPLLFLLLLTTGLTAFAGGQKDKDARRKSRKAVLQSHATPYKRSRSRRRWRNKERGRSYFSQRGGNRAVSDPTTVPIVDDDFLMMAVRTRAQIRADEAHQFSTGADVVVAVLDGGFDLTHPDIERNILHWMGYDAIDHDFDPQEAVGNGIDDDADGLTDGGVGHGTFVVGMILTAAPDAWIVPIRIHDDEGWGTTGELERGLEHALNTGAHIVNISASMMRGRSNYAVNLIRMMRERGTVVVTSAGNEGRDSVSLIGDEEDTLTVGAVDVHDRVAPFSNRSWDENVNMVFAPGVDLYGPFSGMAGPQWAYWSGTSFSAGLVSGAAALVRSRQPWISARWIMQILMESVEPAFDEEGRPMPYGRIDLLQAVVR